LPKVLEGEKVENAGKMLGNAEKCGKGLRVLANSERQANKMPQLRRHLRMPLGLVQMQNQGETWAKNKDPYIESNAKEKVL